jgi:hypothetical protein
MTSERKVLLLSLPFALLAACGNYSNEDLEYMNALPQGDELRAEIPKVSSALAPEDEAELAKQTHDTTGGFNGLVTGLARIVDTVRSLPPTSRTPISRTWGPYAPEPGKLVNRDWWTRMTVSRNLDDPDQFDYEIAVHKAGNGDLDWPVVIAGSFRAGETARRGRGHIQLTTAKARAEGMVFVGMETLDHLEIDYDTVSDPVSVKLTITALPPLLSNDPPPVVAYTYKANAAGQGQMTFDVYGNLPATGPAIEHVNVTAMWLPSGEGRALGTVVEGDGMGAHRTQCWDSQFRQTFNDGWGPGQTAGTATLCPDISPL